MVHQNVCLDAVFVDTGGEWKLGGLELLRTKSDAALALQPQPAYMPPEYLQGGGGAVSATRFVVGRRIQPIDWSWLHQSPKIWFCLLRPAQFG